MDRAAEAESHVKNAQKASKSGFFKKPDWDVAAIEWDSAASMFMVLKQTERAAECYKEAHEAHYKAGNLFFSARSLENLARLCQDKKDLQKAAMWLEKAAEIYAEDGKLDKQAATLTKAGKMLLDDDVERGLELLEKSASIYAEEDKWHLCGDTFRYLTSAYIKLGRWADAIQSIQKKMPGYVNMDQPHNLHKCYAEMIIIHLASKDSVAAEKMYETAMQTKGFSTSDEASACGSLLTAYNNGDEEQLAACAKNQTFTFLTTEVARLVRNIQPTGVKKVADTNGHAPRDPADPLAPTADTEELRDDFLC